MAVSLDHGDIAPDGILPSALDISVGDGDSLSMGRGHGDLSFLLLRGVMPRCPTSVKLFSAADRSQGLGRSRFVLESRITFQVIA